MNILLIEDDIETARVMRRRIETHFRKQGIRLYHSDTIAGGLKLANGDKSIKLVLFDLGMPCVETPMEAVLKYVHCFTCNVACYTAHQDEGLIQAAINEGAVAFISKWESAEDQLEQIDKLVSQIVSAMVRMNTEEAAGKIITTRKAARYGIPGILATAVAVVTILSFFGGRMFGFWDFAKDAGIKEENVRGHFEQLDKSVEELKSEQSLTRATQQRMDKNIVKLLQAAGIQPSRDGE